MGRLPYYKECESHLKDHKHMPSWIRILERELDELLPQQSASVAKPGAGVGYSPHSTSQTEAYGIRRAESVVREELSYCRRLYGAQAEARDMLTLMQGEIVRLRYDLRMSAKEIQSKLFISESTYKREKRKAIMTVWRCIKHIRPPKRR